MAKKARLAGPVKGPRRNVGVFRAECGDGVVGDGIST